MDIAYVSAKGHGATDRLLNNIANRLASEGVRMVGALRAVGQDIEAGHCSGTLRILPDEAQVRISQDLGSGSIACRMDSSAIAEAAGLAETHLVSQSTDLVVINKFGVSEAEGRGFRALIVKAFERGVPVLIGLSDTHRAAFNVFTEGLATGLPSDEEAILVWYQKVAIQRSSVFFADKQEVAQAS